MNNKLLSIVVISYKETKRQVLSTLKSIDSQQGIDFNNIEVIVVNDCGTPLYPNGTITNFDSLENINVKYLVAPSNGGPLLARQLGYINATGKYITFFDTEDSFSYIFALYLFFQSIKTNDFDYITMSRIKEECSNPNYLETKEAPAIYYIYESGKLCNFHGKFINRQFIQDAEIEWLNTKELAAEDEFFIRQIFDAGKTKFDITDPCYLYRYNRNSLTHAGIVSEFYARIYVDYLRLMDKYLDIVAKKYPEKLEQHVSYFFQKTYLFLESRYFAQFPEHRDNSLVRFKDFYKKWKSYQTQDKDIEDSLFAALGSEIGEAPTKTYKEFIKEIGGTENGEQ